MNPTVCSICLEEIPEYQASYHSAVLDQSSHIKCGDRLFARIVREHDLRAAAARAGIITDPVTGVTMQCLPDTKLVVYADRDETTRDAPCGLEYRTP